MSEWNYVRNSAEGSLWGAPNQLSQDGKNYRRSFPRRQKWKNIFVDYLSISGYNKNIENNIQNACSGGIYHAET